MYSLILKLMEDIRSFEMREFEFRNIMVYLVITKILLLTKSL